MTQDVLLANCQLVLPGEVVRGSIRLEGGRITAIDTGTTVPAGAEDCGGDFVAPGLIELHTDNLERHLSPRPKVSWPHRAAIIAHDRELAGTGITTVYDAIRVGSILSTGDREGYGKYARQMADAILSMRAAGALRISHHLHLRAETCSETLLEELAEFGPDDRVGIVSLMDHTPGQRQFSDISKFEDYVRGKHGMTKARFDAYVQFLVDLHARLGADHEAGAVEAARRYGATLASHDDTTEAQVAVSRDHGVRIAEFPTTVEAAKACEDADIAVIMGAPNLVRGGSHSGNVAAEELARKDCLDILSSDYVPSALLLGAFQLGEVWGDVARGLRTVTAAPARAVGLEDRGVLEPGRRGDLIRFANVAGAPALQGVWSDGHRVG
ncbi:MAG: alpha-D-ribose 1-methylphosphonate 5-triphosphate diphosphatase [Pseudomonadota bacterium]